MTVLVRQGHIHASVVHHITLHGIFDHGGIGFQTSGQGVDQHVRLIEILACIQMVSVGVALGAVFQTQGTEEVGTLHLIHGIEHLHMAVSTAIRGGFGELDDIGHLQVSKLNAGNGITVALAAVAQIGLVIGIAVTDSTAQGVDHILIVDTGGHIRAIPDTVLFRVRDIVFVDIHAAQAVRINGCVLGGIFTLHSGGADGICQQQHQGKTQGNCLFQIFHNFAVSFHSCNNDFEIDNELVFGDKKSQGRSLAR